ncbi:IS30 family transposase [Thiomonas sp.]
MGSAKHGRCRRGVRPALGSIGRPGAGTREVRQHFWRAIAEGLSSDKAAEVAGVSPAVGARLFRQGGGMPDVSLEQPSNRFLSLVEREEIALLRAQGHGVRDIARRIGRHASTISRELRRNAATRSGYVEYRATTAHWHAQRRARRPRTAKLTANPLLKAYVQERIAGGVTTADGRRVGPRVAWSGRRHGRRQDRHWAIAWSPQQIANRLPIDYPDDPSMRISHEAIYQALYIGGRGGLHRELCASLRTGRALRMPRARVRARGKQFVGPQDLIDKRPAKVSERREPGHWEGDLIIGLDSSAIGTLVERKTRYTLLMHLPRQAGFGAKQVKNGPALAGRGADAVREAIALALMPLPRRLRKSLTWDQGSEMAQHKRLRHETGIRTFFCEPRSPWQRGTNENTNGLLRQYFPKGTDLSRYDSANLQAVANALNNRPRKVLGWKTPAEVFENLVSSENRRRVATTG